MSLFPLISGIANDDTSARLTNLLVDHRLLGLIASGLTSRDPHLVSASVFLLTESVAASSSREGSLDSNAGFGFDAFASKLAHLNADRESQAGRPSRLRRDDDSDASLSSDYPSKRPASMMTSGDNKENVFSAFGRHVNVKDVPSPSETKVDSLLSRLNSVEDAGDVKDLRTSEILSVYEQKFKSLSMKENHLQVSDPSRDVIALQTLDRKWKALNLIHF